MNGRVELLIYWRVTHFMFHIMFAYIIYNMHMTVDVPGSFAHIQQQEHCFRITFAHES